MPLDQDIRAYEANQRDLEDKYYGKFVVFHGGQFVGVYDNFDAAGNVALQRFGDNPSLIRKVGESVDTHLAVTTARSQ